jgi:hypothetical protein
MKRPSVKPLARITALLGTLGALSLAQAQPVITGITPDGNVQFQPSSTLAFTISDSAAVTNIMVTLNGTKITGASFVRVYTQNAGLTINGSNVSAPVAPNTIYSANIQMTDSNGVSANSSVVFDTINPAYTFESEDFDYQSGRYFDNPQTNAYRNLVAVDGVDAHNTDGANAYRPSGTADAPGGLATEGCGDKPRAQFVGTAMTDYDVGWTGGGDWANYTRHFPAGKWNMYVRASNPNGAQRNAFELALDGNTLGQFAVPNTGGWQTYTFVPLTDSSGTLVEVDFDGGVHTLRETVVGGSYNMNYFMLLPVSAPSSPSDVTLASSYPDGTYQFQATNQFTFELTSPSGFNAADITLQLSETDLAGVSTSKILLAANGGLTLTRTASGYIVSTPLASNRVYSAFIQVDQTGHDTFSTVLKFDTLTPAYTFEAEDWDYGSGQFIDNPQLDQYLGLDGVEGVDFARPSTGGGSAYGRVGLATENANDIARYDHQGYPDYDIGNNGSGNWVNYTRSWPTGTFNIYIRTANGNGSATTKAGSLSLVTSGVGTPNQTVLTLGTYDSPSTGGWQSYTWRPLIDAGGNLMQFVAGGVKTLRHTVINGNANQGFYLLMPADLTIHTKPFVSNIHPDGSAMFQYTNIFSFTVNSAAGVPKENVVLILDGVKTSMTTFTGTPNIWNVTCPVGINAFHTAQIMLTDDYGSTTNTVSFGTFDPAATYIFEAEDYDHSGGQFFDNPQVNSYQGLDAIPEVDTHTVPGNFDGTHVPYRPSGLNQENAGDAFELPAHAGVQNYDLGNTSAGNWGNYTRTYPAGTFNIYMRASNGTGGSSQGGSMQVVTSGRGTANQTVTNLGTFELVLPTGGWQSYTWVPLKDNNGNLAQFTGGAVRTLRATCGGGQNMDYYALVPVDPSRPVMRGLYPDGSVMFQQTNLMSFVAASSAGIDTKNIVVTLNGVPLTNLVFSGSSTSWTVRYPRLQTNTSYAATISFTSLNGGAFSTTFSFDTYSAAYYTWEAEDFDATTNGVSGVYFDSPQVGNYLGLGFNPGVDGFQNNNGVNGFSYRPNDGVNLPPGTPAAGDGARTQFPGTSDATTDYRLTWFGDSGSWLNYTRHYPAGTYNVLGRFTEGAAPTTESLSIVTSGYGTTTQVKNLLGTFYIPLGGWNTWQYTPLTDPYGNRVQVTFDGSRTTLQLGGDPSATTINANFFMLIPVPASAPQLTMSHVNGRLTLSWPTRVGTSYQVQIKSSLSDPNWSSVGVVLAGTGSVRTFQDNLSAAARFYRVQEITP